jgi:hypothetical protein
VIELCTCETVNIPLNPEHLRIWIVKEIQCCLVYRTNKQVQVSIWLCDAASLGVWFPNFQDSVVVLSSRVESQRG